MDGNCSNEITAVELARRNFDPHPIFVYNKRQCAEVNEEPKLEEKEKNPEIWFENVNDFIYECELCTRFLPNFEQLKLHIEEHKAQSPNQHVESFSSQEYEKNGNNNKDKNSEDDQRKQIQKDGSTSSSILKMMLEFSPDSNSNLNSSQANVLHLEQNHNLKPLKSSAVSLTELLNTSQMSAPLNRVSSQIAVKRPPHQFSQLSRAHFQNFRTKYQILNKSQNGLDLTTRSQHQFSHSHNPNPNFNSNSKVKSKIRYVQNSPASVNSESPSRVFISNSDSSRTSTPAPVSVPATKIGHQTVSYAYRLLQSNNNNGKKLKLSQPDLNLKTLVSNHQDAWDRNRNFACDLCFFNNSIANQFDSMEQLDQHKREFHKIVKPFITIQLV